MLTKKSLDWTWIILGVLFLGFFHLFGLKEVPGFHFDEAWAFNFSYRIANEPGFWPLGAMSPYTAPWTHYWAALWMKLIHPSIFVFRMSQMLLTMCGIFLLCTALWKNYRRAASLLPLTISLLPGLVLNHRFAIELNGFHVFCFGLFLWSVSAKKYWLLCLSFLLGTTAHILFYGVGVGLLCAMVWEEKKIPARIWIVIAFSLLSLFFFRVYLFVPEKGKALALFSSSVIFALFFLVRAESWKILQKIRFETLVAITAAVFLCNAFFFLEGSWNLAIQTGRIFWKGWGLLGIFAFLPISVWLIRVGTKQTPRWMKRWFLFLVIALGVMMLKPAPRYYEIIFLCLAIFLSMGLAQRKLLPRLALILLLALHAIPIYATYFSSQPREEDLRLLFWKDSSRDFLSKQQLASVLGGSGCRFSDIKRADSRVREALFSLQHSDWPVVNKKCQFSEVKTRREEGVGQREGEFILIQ